MRKTVVITTVLGLCLLGMSGKAQAQDATGSGTLTVAGTPYVFQVTWCDLGKTQGPDGPTVSGTGMTEGGVRFMVTVDRTTLNNTTYQEVNVYLMDGSGLLSSLSISMGSGWMTSGGIVPDPLIKIDGQHVSATGAFEDQNSEPAGEGTLEADCE